jgi:hypothetical protein
MSTAGIAVSLVDAVLILIAVYGIGIVAFARVRQRAGLIRSIVANLIAGAALMLALRLALVDARFLFIAACLLVSLIAHGFDIRARWMRN